MEHRWLLGLIITLIMQISLSWSHLDQSDSAPTSILKTFKFGKLSIQLLEDDHDDHWSPPRNRSGPWYPDHEFSKGDTSSEDDDDADDDQNITNGHQENVLDFKLSNLLKLGRKFLESNSDQNTEGYKSKLDELNRFLTTFQDGRSIADQPISLRSIRRFLKSKLDRTLSAACLGDLVYFVDSLLEYSLARHDLSNNCRRPLDNAIDCNCTERIQSTLDENEWTLDVIDSFGKFPSGVTKGNLWFLGDFEQCTGISVQKSSPKHKWEGLYSRVDFYLYKDKLASTFVEDDKRGMFSGIESGLNIVQLPSSLPECNVFFQLKYGACFPKTCNRHDLETIIEYVINVPQKLSGKRVVCAADVLHHDSPTIFNDPVSLFIAFAIMAIVAIAIFGTCYDYEINRKPEDFGSLYEKNNFNNDTKFKSEEVVSSSNSKQPLLVQILLAFSLLKNAKKIFDMSSDSTKDHVKCLHGIRALSMLWVLWAHSYSSGILFIDNIFDILAMPNYILNHLILNATLSVDAFFLMSGTLLAFLWLKEMKRTAAKNLYNLKSWALLYLHRYLRLTPVYAFVLFTQIFLIKYATDGPLWNPGGFEPKICRTGWWTNLLYINNMISLDRMCMVWSWYLANDMQFFFLSPPLLILLWINGAAGMAIITLLIMVTSILRGVIVMSNDAFPPVNIMFNNLDKLQSVEEFTSKVYISPHCRCGPYLIGLLLGYILYRYKDQIKLSKAANIVAWLCSFTLGLGILFGLYDFCKTGYMPNVAKFIYGSFGRVLWTMFVAWIVLAGSTGHGGVINHFLSSRRWKPLSRLVYCAYLIHPTIMLLFYSSFMKPIHYEGHFQAVSVFFGHVILTFFFAFWLSCLVELPLANLEPIFFKRNARNDKSRISPVRNTTTQQLLPSDDYVENTVAQQRVRL